MSHEAISHAQFGEQLKMFMSPDEIIDYAHKGDSAISGTPREEWEALGSSTHGPNTSLRGEKLADLDPGGSHYEKFYGHKSWLSAPPIRIYHGFSSTADKWLAEGHHRLAFAEKHDIPLIAVRHMES